MPATIRSLLQTVRIPPCPPRFKHSSTMGLVSSPERVIDGMNWGPGVQRSVPGYQQTTLSWPKIHIRSKKRRAGGITYPGYWRWDAQMAFLPRTARSQRKNQLIGWFRSMAC